MTIKKIFLPVIIISFICFVFIFLLDRVLGLLGFASEIPPRFAHPPNHREIRKNLEYEYIFSTNSQGLRYKEIPLAKPGNEFRILVLGDSYTEGLGVKAEKIFTSLLEGYFKGKNNKHIAFINAGLAGTGPFNYWEIFFNVGLKYDLDGVLICIYANDVSNLSEGITKRDLYYSPKKRPGAKELLHTLFPRIYTLIKKLRNRYTYRQNTQPADFLAEVSRRALRAGISKEKIEDWKKKIPGYLVKAVNRGEYNGYILVYGLFNPHYWGYCLEIDGEKAERCYRSMIVVLEEIVKVAAHKGIEFAVVYFPTPFQYDPSRHEPDNPWIQSGSYIKKEWLSGDAEIQKRLAQWTATKNLPFLDLTPIFRKEIKKKQLNYKLDGHWNSAGHFTAFKTIRDWLENNKVYKFWCRFVLRPVSSPGEE